MLPSQNLSIYQTRKDIKKSYKNNKIKISGSTWNEKFGLPDRSYSVSDIQDCFKYTIKKKKHEAVTDNPPIRIYVNKIEKMITLRIKTGHYLELLTPETMKDKNDENVLLLEINELVLVHCYIVDNDY